MYKYTLLMTDSGYYIWGERRRNRSFDYKIKSINPRGKFDGFKDNRNKEKCKAEHGEKAAACEEDEYKVCKICEDNQKEYHIKSCATGRIISCNGDSDLGDACGRNSAHDQQFRTCRCIWKKDCSTAAGNDGLDGVCISIAVVLWSRVCGFQ